MADYTIMVIGEALSQALGAAAPRARLHIRLVRESLRHRVLGRHPVRGRHGRAADATGSRCRTPGRRSCSATGGCAWSTATTRCSTAAARCELRDLAGLPWVAPYYRATSGGSPSVPVMRQLALLDLQPRIAVRVESYLAVPYFVTGTDRVALMQERLATRLAAQANLRVLECPGDAEPIVEALWWHRQYEDDTAHAWLRRLIVETARRL